MITPAEYKRLNYGEEKAAQHNAAVVLNTDILATALTPTETEYPVIFRVMVCFSAIGVFSAMITRALNTQQVDFNSGGNLVAGAGYVFDLLMHVGDSVNFRYSATTTMRVLRVQEVKVAS